MRSIRRLLKSEGGFTLAESLIAIGIMSMCLTMVGAPMFNVLRHDEAWRADITATTALQRATTYMSKDAIKAETTSLADGNSPVDTLTVTWEDLGGVPHTALYTLDSNNLIRSLDGVSSVIARDVGSVGFSRDGRLLTFSITIEYGVSEVETKTSAHFLRSLE